MDWTTQDVPLQFGLADWSYLTVRRRLEVAELPLSFDAGADALPAPPGPALPPGSQGFLLRRARLGGAPSEPVAVGGGFVRYVLRQYRHCYIDLSRSFEEYQAKFSSRTRATLRRKVRRFAEQAGGGMAWRRYAAPHEMEAFFEQARAVSEKTYQERLLDAGLPAHGGFVEELRDMAARDAVRGYLLFAGETPVAYLYCPARGGTLVYARLGYDPAYARLSAGTVLLWLSLEDLFRERRFAVFDFMTGDSEQKDLFATDALLRADVLFLRDTLFHRGLVELHRRAEALSRAGGGLLARHGLKARVKRLLGAVRPGAGARGARGLP